MKSSERRRSIKQQNIWNYTVLQNLRGNWKHFWPLHRALLEIVLLLVNHWPPKCILLIVILKMLENSSGNIHCEKYRNFTWFPGVEILRKGTVSASPETMRKLPFRKISIPENQVKLRYFSQWSVMEFIFWSISIWAREKNWVEVLKNVTSNFLIAVFHKFYLVHSWIYLDSNELICLCLPKIFKAYFPWNWNCYSQSILKLCQPENLKVLLPFTSLTCKFNSNS